MPKKISPISTIKYLAILLFTFLAFPISASAAWWNPLSWIGNAAIGIVAGIPIGLVSILSYIIMSAVAVVSSLMGAVMGWIIDASLNVPVLTGVAFVETGWGITRDLMNMVFILILVFIGLATILRLKSYEIQKTLPTLIIIALLINFSGVLVGVIVDFSNLIANFFIKGVGSFDFSFTAIADQGQQLGNQLVGLVVNLGDSQGEYIGALVQPLISIVAIIAFYAILIITIFAIMLIFLLRIVFLWILVILAPIAFASYILPATRGFWNSWWKNLIQWSIVGIPISFFLYLSGQIILKTGSQNINDIFTKAGGAGANWLSNLIFSFLAPTVVIVLLIYGIGIAIAGAPAGAKGIMQAADRGIKAGGKVIGKRAWQGTKQYAKNRYNNIKNIPGDVKRDFRSARASGKNPIRAGASATLGGIFKSVKRDDLVKLSTAPINAVVAGKARYNLGKNSGYNKRESLISAFRKGGKTILKNKTAAGIQGAIKNAFTEGWKAAAKPKKKRNTKKTATGVIFECDFCKNTWTDPTLTKCPRCLNDVTP